MKKKYISIVLSMLVLFSLAGCNKGVTTVDNQSTDTNYALPHENTPPDKKQDKVQINGAQLSDYTDEGMRLFESDFKTKSELILALKNIGNNIGDYAVTTQKGETINLASLNGKNILIDVVNATCSDCLSTAPIIADVLSKTDKDITLIPIFINSKDENIDNFYKSLSIDKPVNVVSDTKNESKKKFSLTKTPTLIYIDKTGMISYIMEEKVDKQSFTDSLVSAFDDSTKKLYEYKETIEDKENKEN